MNFIEAVKSVKSGGRLMVPKEEGESVNSFLVYDGSWFYWEDDADEFVPSVSLILRNDWEVVK